LLRFLSSWFYREFWTVAINLSILTGRLPLKGVGKILVQIAYTSSFMEAA
jgi:hypothetical protein